MRCKACNSKLFIVTRKTVLVDPVKKTYAEIEEELCNKCIGKTYKDETMDHLLPDITEGSLGNGNYITEPKPMSS